MAGSNSFFKQMFIVFLLLLLASAFTLFYFLTKKSSNASCYLESIQSLQSTALVGQDGNLSVEEVLQINIPGKASACGITRRLATAVKDKSGNQVRRLHYNVVGLSIDGKLIPILPPKFEENLIVFSLGHAELELGAGEHTFSFKYDVTGSVFSGVENKLIWNASSSFKDIISSISVDVTLPFGATPLNLDAFVPASNIVNRKTKASANQAEIASPVEYKLVNDMGPSKSEIRRVVRITSKAALPPPQDLVVVISWVEAKR